jgi:hypothetical protein
MTAQAETAEGTSAELAPVAPGAIDRVKGDKPWSMLDLAEILARPAAQFGGEADKLPVPAPKVKFTDKLRQALKSLPDLFGQVMPDEVRVLDRHELKAITEEAVALALIEKEAKARLDNIRKVIRNHQDKAAEAAGLPEGTQRVSEGVAKGHWLLAAEGEPHKTPVDGYADPWQQQKVSGKVTVDYSVLGDLARDGEVTRAEFLALTREVRAFDEAKAQDFIRKNPGRGLAILARMTRRSAPSATLVSPKK